MFYSSSFYDDFIPAPRSASCLSSSERGKSNHRAAVSSAPVPSKSSLRKIRSHGAISFQADGEEGPDPSLSGKQTSRKKSKPKNKKHSAPAPKPHLQEVEQVASLLALGLSAPRFSGILKKSKSKRQRQASRMSRYIYQRSGLSLAHYRQLHGDFDAHGAAAWMERVQKDGMYSSHIEMMFVDAILGADEPWIHYLEPCIKRKMDLETEARALVHQQKYEVLSKLLPHMVNSACYRVLHEALDRKDLAAIDVIMPFNNPMSQNSQILQMVATEYGSCPELVSAAIKWSDPKKASRHLLYLRKEKEADLILSNPATDVDLIPASIQYAATHQVRLPASEARYQKHILGQSLGNASSLENDLPTRRRKI